MSSKASNRMSLRPRRTGKYIFEVGDVVEVTYRNGIELGTLLCKVNSDKWIVKYKNNNLHEEQVSEKTFGRLLAKKSSSDKTSSRRRSLMYRKAFDAKLNVDRSKKNQSSLPGKRKIRNANKRSKLSSQGEETMEKETSPNADEVKSVQGRRKNRITIENHSNEVVENDSDVLAKTKKTHETGTDSNDTNCEQKLSAREKRLRMRLEAAEDIKEQRLKKRSKRENDIDYIGNIKKEKEEVVKVKMNTGTLYLYRGTNPRAVFVRKY